MATQFKPADRILALPPYLFAELDKLKEEALSEGRDVINLGVGDPDLATPDFIVSALAQASADSSTHHYPSYAGRKEFRIAACEWFKGRFGVDLDPNTEIVTLIGSKEGIAHLPLAVLNPGDKALIPNPGYPVYAVATEFAGGEPVRFNLDADNNFLPKLDDDFKKKVEKSKLLFLNYPNNPTAACATREFFEKLIEMLQGTNCVLCHDNAYSELYYDGLPSLSVLEVEGGKDVAIEMHSFSKSFNMTGWRLGFAVGNQAVVQALGKVKTNVDSGVFDAIQLAGIRALKEGKDALQKQRMIFQKRRDLLADCLEDAGFEFKKPEATFYFWVKVPGTESATDFCKRVLREQSVVVTPGVGMGDNGEGYFRITFTASEQRLAEAGKRLKNLMTS